MTSAEPGGPSVQISPERRRRWLIGTIVSVVVVVALVVGGPWVYAKLVHGDDADPLTLSTPTATPGVDDEPTGPIDIDGTWQVADGSAGYRVGEVLSGQQVTAVGRTDQVSGTVTITDGTLTDAAVVVDTGSISTDESARDAYFRRALDTTQFPEATFELTAPVDVSAVGASAEAVSVAAVGTLTFHGVTQPATAALEVQRTREGVEVVGSIPVTLEDYGLTAPQLPFVAVEPTGTVELLVALTR